MNIAGKVWGSTSLLFKSNNVELHRIEGRKGGFCSKHCHEHKFNRFYVERGRLRIHVWKKGYDLVDVTDIGPGQETTVPPGEFHQFEVLEDAIAFEIYWTELDGDDIVRETIGGVKK